MKQAVLLHGTGGNDKDYFWFANTVGVKFFLAEGQGHMGSLSFNQPMPDFPLLKDLLSI